MRCPGDEASRALGFVAMLQRHPVKLWLVSTVLLISVAVFAALYPALREVIGSSWKVLFLVVLGPLLFGLPLRLLIYGLAYGRDLFGLPLVCTVSAEVTPPGPGTTRLVEPQDAEELRAAHSEIYELPRVYDFLADWFQACGRPGWRRSGNEQPPPPEPV